MDTSHHFQSSDYLFRSIELLEASLKTKSVDEFAKNGLSSLADMIQASSLFLHLKETKYFSPRFFHHRLQPDKAQLIAEMSEKWLHTFSQDGGLQQATLTLPALNGPEEDIVLYKLQKNGEPLGLMGLSNNGADSLFPPEVRERFINLAIQAVGKLVEDEDATHDLAYLRTYQTVSSLLSQTMELHELLDMALYSCMDVVSAEAASVLLLTDNKENFNFYQVEGDAKPLLNEKNFPADSGIAGSVLMSRQSEIVHDVQNDPRFYGSIDSETGFKTRNMIVIPLLAGDEPVGILEMLNKAGGGKFTEKERLLLCSIAEEIAFAIRNAKVFDYVVGTYCKQRQGQMSCKGCKRPLGSWTPCVKYQESEFKKMALIEPTIYHDLKDGSGTTGEARNRRRSIRSTIVLPAIIGGITSHIEEYEMASVLDISLEGIRFSVPAETKLQNKILGEAQEFNLIFILANEQRPLKVKCRLKWVSDFEGGVHIGAAFVDPNSQIQQILQKYLT